MTKYCFYAAVLYSFFVVYGSLVPLDYQSIPWHEALDRFKNIPYLDLGIESRADWIANILLYIPLSFLWLAASQTIRSGSLRVFCAIFTLFFCLFLAITVEFVQLFSPPRTVSVNDLIAESMGTGVGWLLYAVWGNHVIKVYDNLSLGAFLTVKTVTKLYILGYLVLSFFPFDFVTSFSELEIKLAQSHDHILMSWDACQEEGLRCLVKFLVEILVLLPAGGLLYLLPHVAHKTALAIIIGFFLGVVSELVQLFLFSGTAQGVSVITRILGMVLGVISADWLSRQKIVYWQRGLRPFVIVSILPYMVALFIINGGRDDQWLPIASVSSKLADTHFLPFYYFYYTTETIALVSLISNIGSYIPIGIAYWLWCRAVSESKRISLIVIGLSGSILAVLVEIEKLFLADKHADPTDILIAFGAAAGSYALINKAVHWITVEKNAHSK